MAGIAVNYSSVAYLLSLKFENKDDITDFVNKYPFSKLTKWHGDVLAKAPNYRRLDLLCECAGIYVSRVPEAQRKRRTSSKKKNCLFCLHLVLNERDNCLQVDEEQSVFVHNAECLLYHGRKPEAETIVEASNSKETCTESTENAVDENQETSALLVDDIPESPEAVKDKLEKTNNSVYESLEEEEYHQVLKEMGASIWVSDNQCTNNHSKLTSSSPKKNDAENSSIMRNESTDLEKNESEDNLLSESIESDFESQNFIFDKNDVKSKGRNLHSETKTTIGAPVRKVLSSFEEKDEKQKAYWLLKLWLGDEKDLLKNILEGCVDVNTSHVLKWSQNLPDTFQDQLVDVDVLKELKYVGTDKKVYSIFNENVLRLLKRKVEAAKNAGIFICLTCLDECGDDDAGQCTSCLRWYHGVCIKTQRMTFKKGKSAWFCNTCQDLTKSK